MPQFPSRCRPGDPTPEELTKLLELRRQALADATVEHGLGKPLPVSWRHGWKAFLRVLGRSQDGSLCANIVVEGPRGEIAYRRSVRLVTKRPLPFELGQG